MKEKLKIGIILGSTRSGRVSPQVGEWVKKVADERNDAHYELIDIAEYRLPFVGKANPIMKKSGLGRKKSEKWMDLCSLLLNIITVSLEL